MKRVLIITLMATYSYNAHGMNQQERDIESGCPSASANSSLIPNTIYYPQYNHPSSTEAYPIVPLTDIHQQSHQYPVVIQVPRVHHERREKWYAVGIVCFAVGFVWGVNLGLNQCS